MLPSTDSTACIEAGPLCVDAGPPKLGGMLAKVTAPVAKAAVLAKAATVAPAAVLPKGAGVHTFAKGVCEHMRVAGVARVLP